MGWKVESEFEHDGLKCVVIFTEMGHRCGYVGVSEDHPLYKVGYSDKAECLKRENMNDFTVDRAGIGQLLQSMAGGYESENLSPEMFCEVHGGITYSGGGKDSHYPIDSDMWWFGYDTAHYGDGKNLSQALVYDLITLERYGQQMDFERQFHFSDEPVRSLEYCESECKTLAEQLSKIVGDHHA